MFGERLETVEVTCPAKPLALDRKEFWGKLATKQQQQLCIQLIVNKSPHLRKIRSIVTSLDLTCNDPIVGFKNVVSMHFDRPCNHKVIEITPKWLSKLSEMEKLTTLHLDACRLVVEKSSTPSQARFDNLESLTLSTNLAALSHLSHVFHCARLTHLGVHIDTTCSSSPIDWWETAASVRRLIYSTRRSLQTIDIEGQPGSQQEPRPSLNDNHISVSQHQSDTAEPRSVPVEKIRKTPIYGALYNLHRASIYRGFDQSQSGVLRFYKDKDTPEQDDSRSQRWHLLMDYKNDVIQDDQCSLVENECLEDGGISVYRVPEADGSFQCTIAGDHIKSSLYLNHDLSDIVI